MQGIGWLAQLSPEGRLKGWLLLALVISLLLVMLMISFTLLRRWRIQNQPVFGKLNKQEKATLDPWEESARRMRVDPEEPTPEDLDEIEEEEDEEDEERPGS